MEKLSAGDRTFIDQQQKAAKKKREAAAKALAQARAKELDKLLNPLPPQRGRGSVWGNGNGGYLGAGIKDYFAGSKLTFGNNEFNITLAAPGTLYEGGLRPTRRVDEDRPDQEAQAD